MQLLVSLNYCECLTIDDKSVFFANKSTQEKQAPTKKLEKQLSKAKRKSAEVEERLIYESYEDPNQTFKIAQYPPLYQKINSATIQNTLRLINRNMMKCPRSDGLEQILDKINTENAYQII